MRIAFLPFNAGEGASEALARQSANFISDVLRFTEAADEIGTINYMRTVEEEGVTRYVLANPSQALNEPELLQEVKGQASPDVLIDGLHTGDLNSGTLHVRWIEGNTEKPEFEKEVSWTKGQMITSLYDLVTALLVRANTELPEDRKDAATLFGTSNDEAFLSWMTALDGLQYIDRAQGMVATDWDVKPSLEGALKALELDPQLDRAMGILIELARRCAQFGLTDRDTVVGALDRLEALKPEDPITLFNLGSFYVNVGDPNKGSDLLEKASRLEPNEPAIWSALGAAQMGLGMPVNAERSLRKACDLQQPDAFDVTPWDMMTAVLNGQNRGHEVPGMWKALVDSQPQNGLASARYAQSLLAMENEKGAIDFMEKALERLDDNLIVKRVYAPILRDKEDFDRAMDFYEDVLEEAGADVTIMLEYADTLTRADRGFEAEKVLRDVLQATEDPNIKAQTQAWLIELEQPKRIEIVKAASDKAEAGDNQAALRDLKPLRNWLADYWKLWVLLASLHNRENEFVPAEEAAKKALELFPACEPAVSELANSLNGQSRHEEAYGLMGNALQAFPQSLPIAIQFGISAKKFGRTDEARQMAKQIREAVGPMENLEQILKEMEA